MKNDVNSEPGPAANEDAARPKKPRAKKSADKGEPKKAATRRGESSKASGKTAAKSRKAEPMAKAAPKKKSAAKAKPKATEKAAEAVPTPQTKVLPIEDPIGDVSDGEAWTYSGEFAETGVESEAESYRAGVAADAIDGTPEEIEAGAQAVDEGSLAKPMKAAEEGARSREREVQASSRPAAKLERLQKILSQAGIASRRHAEEMIVAGRVEVNGQAVTVLGSKADPERDHIRVDGKLLHGAERHRYFLLNKPKGYVTTVSDPEGRPTVMDFVSKLGERVYPVGRLDFQSEGLLLMTNDGTLANQLTHASSGVEKTYLVKISGQPDEEELERLRNGVMIERGGPSSSGLYGTGGRVRTAPAQIRQIRPGVNPWYEVVLTEGRNREIRKMFSAIGHYAEKIRRVGYGPLALDVEPGKVRELNLQEVEALRQAAEGKLRPRRLRTEAMLPKEAGRSAESRPPKRGSWRPADSRTANTRPAKPQGKGRPERGRGNEVRGRGSDFRGRAEEFRGRGNDFRQRGEKGFESRSGAPREAGGERREWQARPRGERPPGGRRDEPRRGFGRRSETQTGRPQFGRRETGKPEDREFRNGASRPGGRWQAGAAQRPFRPEGRTAEDSRGKSRSDTPAKFTAKGKAGNRYPREGKTEGPGREHASGDRGRDRFRSNPNPRPFRTGGQRSGGQRPGGQRSGGQRPGGQHPGGKRRG